MTGPDPQPRKPVILTVDDDPAVSRAVARDLRRHYGENYRIVRAESGQDALETLNELKLRGDTVAVFVADYRMPQMSGIEFLEEAMDLYPLARRVLLTAYADTHAAIDAINVVDLDHYLLKPWDPPEEKLYPVIDGLLEAWRATGDRAIPHTKVIGHRWNPRSWEVRQFLARNQHSFRSFMADESKGKQLLDAAGLDGFQLPVVITEQGETLVEPTNAELAAMLGLSTSPSLEMYDLAVIGGGPAGLGSRGIRRLGGPENRPHRGDHHRRAGRAQLQDRELPRISRPASRAPSSPHRHAGRPSGSAPRSSPHAKRSDWKPTTQARHAPSGSRTAAPSAPRPSSWPPASTTASCESRAAGKTPMTTRATTSVAASTTAPSVSDASECRDENVYIVGGANSAGQAAMYMSREAKSVTLLVRGAVAGGVDVVLPDPADREERQDQGPHLHRGGRTRSARTTTSPALVLENKRTGEKETVDCSRMCCFIGAEPRTEWLDGVVARDDHGFILTGPDLKRRLRLDAGPPAAPPGNKRARCVCCR